MNTLFMLFLQAREQHHMMDTWTTGWLLMILVWVLIVVFIVTLVWFLIKKGGEGGRRYPKATPREILDERYARGDIDEEEYRQRKKELKSEE